MAALIKHYPYTPALTIYGAVDQKSIHSKNTERFLAVATTALAYGAFFRKSSYTWAIIGTAAIGTASFIFWSKLGTWVSNKKADQNIIASIKTQGIITAPMVRRTLWVHPFTAEVLKTILHFPNDIKRVQLMESYATYVLPGTVVPDYAQKRNEHLSDYFQTECAQADEGRKALLLQQAVVLSYSLENFVDALPKTNEAWIELWTKVGSFETGDSLLDLIERSTVIKTIIPETLKILATKAIENENDPLFVVFVSRMNTLFDLLEDDASVAELSSKLPEITKKISPNSRLSKQIMSPKATTSAAQLLRKYNLGE